MKSATPVLSILLFIFIVLDIYLYTSYVNYEKETKILTKELNSLLDKERKETKKKIDDLQNENKIKEKEVQKLKLEVIELQNRKQKVLVKYLREKDKIEKLDEKGVTDYWKNEFNEE
jgi:uncharacterized protein YlxW (UPF0749 family)